MTTSGLEIIRVAVLVAVICLMVPYWSMVWVMARAAGLLDSGSYLDFVWFNWIEAI